MRRRSSGTLTLLLALSLLLPPATASAVPPAVAAARKQGVTQESINRTIDEAVAIETQLDAAAGDLESRSEAAAALKAMLAENEVEASRLASEAVAIQAELDESQAALDDLLRSYYVEGGNPDIAFLDSLLSSRGLDELVARTEYWQRLGEYQTDLVAQVWSKNRELTARRSRLAVITGTVGLMREQYAVEAGDISARIAGLEREHAGLLRRLEALHAREMLVQKQYIQQVEASLDASSADQVTALRAQVVKAALAQVGKPYVWGATGPDSFDCSGLMLYSYRTVGIELPRVSQDQYNGTRWITRDQLQPGDLVFIGYGGSPQAIHHVMMYVGDGYTVEAPRTGDVVKLRPLSSRDPATIAGYTSVFPPAS